MPKLRPIALTAVSLALLASAAVGDTWVEVRPLPAQGVPIVVQPSGMPVGGPAIRLAPRPVQPVRPDTLLITATLANWDADVEFDGLLLQVATLAGAHAVTPRRAEISITLYGERFTTPTRLKAMELARWTRLVQAKDFCGPAGSAVYRLPFAAFDPTRDPRVNADAVVRVSLGVPGVGRLNASAPVQLMEFDPLRDRRFQATGSRRFRGER
ncbi:MAG: hypothetical protein AAGJ46_16985 [Planctomycetota bacterium]